jgi:hypothetical protein
VQGAHRGGSGVVDCRGPERGSENLVMSAPIKVNPRRYPDGMKTVPGEFGGNPVVEVKASKWKRAAKKIFSQG